jgi:hypothetical protein
MFMYKSTFLPKENKVFEDGYLDKLLSRVQHARNQLNPIHSEEDLKYLLTYDIPKLILTAKQFFGDTAPDEFELEMI